MRKCLLLFIASLACLIGARADDAINLTSAAIVIAKDATTPEHKAADMLADEIEKRTYLRLNIVNAVPADAASFIAIGTKQSLNISAKKQSSAIDTPDAPESFTISTASGAPTSVVVAGTDPRGALFGVGKLLRELRMTRTSVILPAPLNVMSSPKVKLRGHQVGYRPKVNTYDAWTPQDFEQYIRDMAVFGTNAIELIPPKSDDAPDSPHFTLTQIDMLARVSQIAHDYGIAFWLWYPAMDKDYGNPATVEAAIAEWAGVLEKIPHIDALLVPGGDPGHTEPKYLMPLLEKQTQNLHKFHPKAEMWVSPQGFTKEWMDQWLGIMNNEQPKWLTGVVFAPQNRLGPQEFRAAIPKQYPIRHYPDITHSYSCQYPVIDWDVALKLTHDREQINPRPVAYAEIFRWSNPYNDAGFITYSEGVNDDANKMLWSALGWDPDADIHQAMREYARYFIGPQYEETIEKAIFGLEQNWIGPLAENKSIAETLALIQSVEQSGNPHVLLDWRFQQLAYRAYFDAYIQKRFEYETQLEKEAMEKFVQLKRVGAEATMESVQKVLDRATTERVAPELRDRISNLAEALYQSIHMQTSVSRFKAIDIGRGATFDFIDRPVNNKLWLESRFKQIRELPDKSDRSKALEAIAHWTDPGPGGFYDDLGDIRNQPHLVRDVTKDFDPETRINPLLGYYPRPIDRRVSWFDDAETRFEAPLYMKYDNLDSNAQYKVRAVYAGDKWDTQMALKADDIEVHGLIDKPNPIAPLEFDIPKEATKDGSLTLAWTQTPGRGSSGRGCQVAEVWLIKSAK